MESRGLQGGIPWLRDKQTKLSVPCVKVPVKTLTHFLLKFSALKNEWEFFWESPISKVEICCPYEAGTFKIFSVDLNDESKCRLLLGELNISFRKVIKDTGNMLQFQCPK